MFFSKMKTFNLIICDTFRFIVLHTVNVHCITDYYCYVRQCAKPTE